MSLVAFSIKLARIDESLLYQDPGGNYWLSCVCTPERGLKGQAGRRAEYPEGTLRGWRERPGCRHLARDSQQIQSARPGLEAL